MSGSLRETATARADVSLALETSNRQGAVALGRDGALLATAVIPQPPRGPAHRVDLMASVDDLCRRHGVSPAQLGEVYISVGPGSFTGLRNAVTTAKMLALTLGCRIVAVPTTDAVVRNAPADWSRAAVCLNSKGASVYAALYERDASGDWRPMGEPRTIDFGQLLAELALPGVAVGILGDHLPKVDWPAAVTYAGEARATARVEVVWQLGQSMARADRFTDPLKLLPLYARVPEAVELWDRRLAERAAAAKR